MARPEGLEPPAYWFEASRSIRLSYGRVRLIVALPPPGMIERVCAIIVVAGALPPLPRMTGPFETEVKIAIEDAETARLLIESRGYRVVAPRTLQSDQVYDLSDRSLRDSGRLLRLRSENGGAILTYKGPAVQGLAHKSREELETSAADGATLHLILERLGFVRSFRYEKYRTTYRAAEEPGIVVLDETPIGVFLELEGPGYWIDRAAETLGFDAKDYVTASYARLYLDFLKQHGGPADMVFCE